MKQARGLVEFEVDLPVGHAEAVEPFGAGDGRGDRRPGRQPLGEAQRVERGASLARRLQRNPGQARRLAGLGVASARR